MMETNNPRGRKMLEQLRSERVLITIRNSRAFFEGTKLEKSTGISNYGKNLADLTCPDIFPSSLQIKS